MLRHKLLKEGKKIMEEVMMITGEQARALYKKATLGGTSYADVMKARDASNVEQNRLMPGVTNLFGAPTGAVDSTAASTLARGMGSPASAPAKGYLNRMLHSITNRAQPKRVNGRRMSYGEPMTQANRNQKYLNRTG